MIETMKKVLVFAATFLFVATMMQSCKTSEHCPAYGNKAGFSVKRSI